MIRIILNAGDSVEIGLADADGKFVVNYGAEELTITSDLPDTAGREGVIYRERYGIESIAQSDLVESAKDHYRTRRAALAQVLQDEFEQMARTQYQDASNSVIRNAIARILASIDSDEVATNDIHFLNVLHGELRYFHSLNTHEVDSDNPIDVDAKIKALAGASTERVLRYVMFD